MRVLIITAAGIASRFNRDLDKPVLKCIFFKEKPQYSILYQMFSRISHCDRIIVVGGYKFKQLVKFIETYLSDFSHKTEVIFNPHFEDYGSGYSLYFGIKTAEKINASEIIFVEGDLFFSKADFRKITSAKGDVLAVNKEPIESSKTVLVYEDLSKHMKYLYDIEHKEFFIKESFHSIYNSAQVWKFINLVRLYESNEKITAFQKTTANLEIIGDYFSSIPKDKISIVTMNNWINCNTMKDYYIMLKYIKKTREE
jgi:CTP:molybdopterin cytidylyltransferase MocA